MRISVVGGVNGVFPVVLRRGPTTFDDGAFLYYAPRASTTAPMKIIWVATTGDDSWDGSSEHPYKTIEKALTVFNSGDQIRILSGTYITTDSIVISYKSGSIFAEDPQGVYIQPEKTTLGQAGIIIEHADRFTIQGINVIQAADSSNNLIGILVDDVQNFICYECSVSNFEAETGDGYGIRASGSLGRIEDCHVSNLVFGENVYGIKATGLDVINCEVENLSGGQGCIPIYQTKI